jgi:hypothetical protein
MDVFHALPFHKSLAERCDDEKVGFIALVDLSFDSPGNPG